MGPDRIVLTESFSKRLFGESDPIGQTVQMLFGPGDFGDEKGLLAFTVSAVVKDNSQAAFGFDALFFGDPSSGLNFFLLKKNVSVPDLQAKQGVWFFREVMVRILRMNSSLFNRLVLIR